MKKDVRTVANEVLVYYNQILDPQKLLTSIQQQQSRSLIDKMLEDQGIKYHFNQPMPYQNQWTYSEGYSVSFDFQLLDISIEDIGIIADASVYGQLCIQIEENNKIEYVPRDFGKLTDLRAMEEFASKAFLNLKKGDNYPFSGKLESCTYFYSSNKFHFVVENEAADTVVEKIKNDLKKKEIEINTQNLNREIEINTQNHNKAVTSGIWGGLLGAGAGFVAGIIVYLIMWMIILPIYSWDEYGLGSKVNHDHDQWPSFVFIICIIIGFLCGYQLNFSSIRRQNKER